MALHIQTLGADLAWKSYSALLVMIPLSNIKGKCADLGPSRALCERKGLHEEFRLPCNLWECIVPARYMEAENCRSDAAILRVCPSGLRGWP